MTRRRIRRMVGVLNARLPELRLDLVPDPRGPVRRWRLSQLLSAALLGLMSGCRSLLEAERLTDSLAPSMRRTLGLPRRVADTTMRDILCRMPLGGLREVLHRLVHAAYQRKALRPEGLPFHSVALDGKVTAIDCWDDRLVQRRIPDEGKPYGLMRTVTCSLVTAPGRPCIDAIPIPAHTNEMGHFQTCLRSLVETYGDLFQVVSYDAGALSLENANAVVKAGKDYLFRLRGDQRTMFKLADELLETEEVVAETEDVLSSHVSVIRRIRILETRPYWSYGRGKKPADSIWPHARTFLQIDSCKERYGEIVERESRMYVSSLPASELSPEQWMRLIRSHWGVENNNHHTLDTAFLEDDRPWITGSPEGALAVLLLRRIAFSLLALFRSVTQRSEDARAIPWRALLLWVRDTLVGASLEEVDGLRSRRVASATL